MDIPRLRVKMEALSELEENWDSYGAKPVAGPAKAVMVELIARLDAWGITAQPSLVPLVDGGLRLEWHQAGLDLEIDVDENGQLVEEAFISFSEMGYGA